jgi:glycosyltransferase involved in cell wall biosynthesis
VSLISIGMPVYNGAKYLRRALDSLLCQSFEDFELIISDNGSDDETWSILKEYQEIDGRILAYKQTHNIGAEQNFSFVLQKAVGDYFMWAACDDWWHHTFIEKLLRGLDAHPTHGVAMCSVRRVHEDGAFIDEVIYTGIDALTNLSYGGLFRRMVKIHPSPPIHLFIYGLFRIEFLRSILKQPIQKSIAADRVLMSEVALATRFYSYANILHVRTVRSSSIAERYEKEGLGRAWKDNLRDSKYLIALLTRLIFSKNIPLKRKLLEIPGPWLLLLWRKRAALANSCFPKILKK